jgi:hypothetical protein
VVGLRVNAKYTSKKQQGTAMKTVPTVRLADASNAAGLPDLPEEIQLAMTDMAGAAREGPPAMSEAAREGPLAMSEAARMAVIQAMFEAEMSRGVRTEGQARCEPGRDAARQRARLGLPRRPEGRVDPGCGSHGRWA